MKRTLALIFAALLAAGAGIFFGYLPGHIEAGRNAVTPHEPYPVSPEARALHETLTIGDLHADSLLWNRNLLTRGTRGQVDFPRLQEGNVAVQVFTAVTKSPAGQNYEANSAEAFDNITPLAIAQLWPPRTWGSLRERALHQAERLHGYAAEAPKTVTVLRSAADLEAHLAARAAGSTAVAGLLGLEGAHPLEGDIANLQVLRDAGYRLIGLHHFFDNALGGSLHGQGDTGLTAFGREVVTRAASQGWVIDLAHSSPQVVRDVLALTDVPLVISHTGLHGHCPVKRNLPDALMREIAATGGVIGMGYWGDVTCGDTTPAGVATMIAAAVETLGEDHVALGSDYDGSVETGFDTSELATLTSALLDAGLSEAQVAKVMGGNMMRVLAARLP